MSGPLKGIRVLDASMGAVGPWAGVLLGQLGADVIKLEVAAGRFHPRRDAGETRPWHHLYLDELQQERARARPEEARGPRKGA